MSSDEEEAQMNESEFDPPEGGAGGAEEQSAEMDGEELDTGEEEVPQSKRARLELESPLGIPEVSLSMPEYNEASAMGENDAEEVEDDADGVGDGGNAVEVPTTLDAICDDLHITDDEEERDGFE